MAYPLLYGEFELAIDDKNRLLIPAEVRRRIDPDRDGIAFFMKVGTNGVPWMYPERYYEELAMRDVPELVAEEDVWAMDRLNFSLASRLEWDKQGRIVIPDRTLKQTSIGKEVTLTGNRDHLELWNRKSWDQYKEVLATRRSELEFKARQARVSQGG